MNDMAQSISTGRSLLTAPNRPSCWAIETPVVATTRLITAHRGCTSIRIMLGIPGNAMIHTALSVGSGVVSPLHATNQDTTDIRYPIATTAANGDAPIDAAETRTWWEWCVRNGVSYLNWSVANKDEASAILKPTTRAKPRFGHSRSSA